MSIDAMKTALEALESPFGRDLNTLSLAVYEATRALRRAIEQAEKQESVCDKDPQGCWNVRCQLGKVCKNTTPPQRQPHELLCVCGASWSIDGEGNEELLSTPPQRQPLTDGWVAVPIEPTDEMLSVLVNIPLRPCVQPGGVTSIEAQGLNVVWSAMLDAAPKHGIGGEA
jgi:hypothetical protein